MQTFQPSIFARHDTLLGICQALGEDLGVNPTWFRASLATLVFFSLGAAVAVYLGVGAIVLASRLLYRAPRKPMPAAEVAQVDAEPVTAENDYEPVLMAAAA
ncbi:MAG: PspC domain-containing protein [Sphingomonadales bacterium]|nr:PspC domain-containing protein [Sphingomonadales bacterium]